MIRIAKISLDIRKDAVVNNEPIILRQGESDVIIEATILNGGDETLQIDFATFVAQKPDGTIVSNDPTNINGSVISYPVSRHLTESVGKIQDAYFVINNEVTTCGFDISIIPSTQLDDTSVSYIPGIENINKFLTDTETDWLGRIQQMKSQIAGLSIPDEFKLLMNKALSDAKAQYQPTIDAAQENVENIAADLAAKKLDLENNSDELNKTILDIKAQIAPVNSFLDNVQKQIIAANASFTADQQAKVSQSISDLKAQTDALVSGSAFQSLQTQVNNSAVGTNLLLGTTDNLTTIQGAGYAAGAFPYTVNIACSAATTFIARAWLHPYSHPMAVQIVWLDASNAVRYKNTNYISAGSSGYSTCTVTIPAGGTLNHVTAVFDKSETDSTQVDYKEFKLEKGSVATDWCPNPSEILTVPDMSGKTITATDDTGKTVNLKITGIS